MNTPKAFLGWFAISVGSVIANLVQAPSWESAIERTLYFSFGTFAGIIHCLIFCTPKEETGK